MNPRAKHSSVTNQEIAVPYDGWRRIKQRNNKKQQAMPKSNIHWSLQLVHTIKIGSSPTVLAFAALSMYDSQLPAINEWGALLYVG